MIHCEGKATVITGTPLELANEFAAITAEMITEGIVEIKEKEGGKLGFDIADDIQNRKEVITVSKGGIL